VERSAEPSSRLPPAFTARVVGVAHLSPVVRELTFERTDGQPMAFEPGQWVSLVLPLESGELRRAYSIASPPDGTPEFQVAVTHVSGGPGSTYLHQLEPGAEITAIGPQGFFTRAPATTHPSLFVATGTGVTPLRSMIRAALTAGSTAPMRLVFGARTRADRLYARELEALAAKHPQLVVEYTLSRPEADWTGRRGYVQEHVRELWEELAARGGEPPHAYICGLQRMVGAVRDLLRKEMQVPRQQVHSERYD
jgi:ferredoxin-NADP reductase